MPPRKIKERKSPKASKKRLQKKRSSIKRKSIKRKSARKSLRGGSTPLTLKPAPTIDVLYQYLSKSSDPTLIPSSKFIVLKLGINGSGKSSVMPQVRTMLKYSSYIDVNTDDIIQFLRLHYNVDREKAYGDARFNIKYINTTATKVGKRCSISRPSSQSSSQSSSQPNLYNALKSDGINGNNIVDLILEKAISCDNVIEIESTGLNIDLKWIDSLKNNGHKCVIVFPYVEFDNILRRTAARNQEVQKYKDTLGNYLKILENIADLVETKNDLIFLDNNGSNRNSQSTLIINTVEEKTRPNKTDLLDKIVKLNSKQKLKTYQEYKSYVIYVVSCMPDEWNQRKPTFQEVETFLKDIENGDYNGDYKLNSLIQKLKNSRVNRVL